MSKFYKPYQIPQVFDPEKKLVEMQIFAEATSPIHFLNIRACIDNFNIESFETGIQLGEGAFGKVHEMIYKKDRSKKFAVKTKSVTFLNSAVNYTENGSQISPEKEIENEIYILKKTQEEKIKLKSLPHFYDSYFYFDEKAGEKFYYLYFELLPLSLGEMLKNQKKVPLPFNKIYHYFKSLLNTLAYLQLKNICHRDLKPGNILLDADQNRIVLIDFGISKDFTLKFQKNLTSYTQTLTGTLNYMAPELRSPDSNLLINDEEKIKTKDPFRSDMFSFGLVMAEILGLEKIKNVDNVKQLQENINGAMKKIKQHYLIENTESKERELRKKFIGMIEQALQIDFRTRPNFLELFLQNINILDEPEWKIGLHILSSDRFGSSNSNNNHDFLDPGSFNNFNFLHYFY